MAYLTLEDYRELRDAMIQSYATMPDQYWKEHQISSLLSRFPEGQVVVKVNGRIAGCALSIIINYDDFEHRHTYREITADYTFKTHTRDGDVLYGIDVFVHPDFRGLRLGRRLYEYRKELCERLNLKAIVFGGRIPNYHKYADTMTPKEYLQQVRERKIHDPVLNFQLSNDFYPSKVLRGYLEGDRASGEYAILLRWDNIYYEKPNEKPKVSRTTVRLGLVQWQMRPYSDTEDLMRQVEYFVDALSGYRCDFALFPEFFNAPLMAAHNEKSEPEAIRALAKHTPLLAQQFQELAISYNINIISGSMPEVKDGKLYNTGYLCRRDGSTESYQKLHVTPDEARVWGMVGGDGLKTFETDCGKIGILVCYDSEFPELSRLLADEGMDILFIPFLTDTQNAYSRVRHCAQARAIENECYVAIAGSVGNLPNVHNMDIQYAQSVVFTPCDFAFPSNGVKAEATPNTEMVLTVDVDISLLRELHKHGSVRILRDRRLDLFELRKKRTQIESTT
ncbi:MAG: bifunctional GNAT family N-acetyltransferase/carbon-nitrogen hydrolase family protein [Turneriella sp.]|nr:bifunctional GNAT family N-acetyltransferase/carbon-nitrogen hydrolase family protein [Turneriella sp.]